MRIRLDIAYDGTAWAGWQVQPRDPTVQESVESALQKIYRRPVRVTGASRTDSGVHALHQVAHFDTQPGDPDVPPNKVRAAIQPWLPGSIAVLRSSLAPPDWHAIASVTSKRYRYLVHEALVPQPMYRRTAFRVRGPLDLDAMREGGEHLLGRHDFAALQTTGTPRKTTVRTILDVAVAEMPMWPLVAPPAMDGHDPGRLIAIEVEGDGFLYNMVRTIAGTLLNVGKRKWPPRRVAEIVASRDRDQAGETAPAAGLWLVRIHYDGPPSPDAEGDSPR